MLKDSWKMVGAGDGLPTKCWSKAGTQWRQFEHMDLGSAIYVQLSCHTKESERSDRIFDRVTPRTHKP